MIASDELSQYISKNILIVNVNTAFWRYLYITPTERFLMIQCRNKETHLVEIFDDNFSRVYDG